MMGGLLSVKNKVQNVICGIGVGGESERDEGAQKSQS